MIDPSRDAFGVALLDYLDGREVPELVLEVQGGGAGPAMHPEWFFRDFDRWEWQDRELLPLIEHGPVLDLGAGAGRAGLYLQDRGLRVTAVDASPGAAEVCRRRGLADVRLGDVNEPPADQAWAGILLLCGNLGLGGSWAGNRRLLARLAGLAAPGAVLSGGSVHSLGSTWTWDGTSWTEQHPAVHPPARWLASMAYDTATGSPVLFGGCCWDGDTWTWDGTTWTQQAPATSPTARYGATIAYDTATGTAVLFGGQTKRKTASDTWVWG